jgi:hypothetical protein
MKHAWVAIIVVLCGLGVAPRAAAAQCHQSCYDIYNPEGKLIGHGCIWDADRVTTCLANVSLCITGDCGGAFLTDANGVVLAEADICRDKVTIRPVSRPGKVSASKPDRHRVPKPERATE